MAVCAEVGCHCLDAVSRVRSQGGPKRLSCLGGGCLGPGLGPEDRRSRRSAGLGCFLCEHKRGGRGKIPARVSERRSKFDSRVVFWADSFHQQHVGLWANGRKRYFRGNIRFADNGNSGGPCSDRAVGTRKKWRSRQAGRYLWSRALCPIATIPSRTNHDRRRPLAQHDSPRRRSLRDLQNPRCSPAAGYFPRD